MRGFHKSMVAAGIALATGLALSACSKAPESAAPLAGGGSLDAVGAPAASSEANAHRLDSRVRPSRYELELSVVPGEARFSGKAEIAVTLERAAKSLRLHGRELAVHQVEAVLKDGSTVAGQWRNTSPTGLAEVSFPQELPAGELRLRFEYDAPFNRTNEGLYRADYAGQAYAFTQFESIDARRAFPAFDEPEFKASFALSLVIKDGHKAVANTAQVGEEALPKGMKRLRFAETPRISTYLLAFAVGDFDIVEGKPIPASSLRPEPIPLRGVAAKGQGEKLKFALDTTAALVENLEQYFGIAYPFGKLDLLAVPDFAAGAMENPGAITFRDTLLLIDGQASMAQKRSLISVNAHELAHQWFGDLVTMRWWTDIWLNEAFATWMGNKAAQAAYPEYDLATATQQGALWAMGEDARPNQRPIRQAILRDEDISSAFDGITYQKGGGVLNMFERFLGEEAFRKGVNAYMTKFAYGNASAEEFIAAVADAAGKPELKAALDSYLRYNGLPLVKAESECRDGELTLKLEQGRYQPLGTRFKDQPLWGVPFCAAAYVDGQPTEACSLLAEARGELKLKLPRCPDYILPNAGGAGYYRWQLDDAAQAQLMGRLDQLPVAEALDAASSLSAAWRAGRIDQNAYLAAVPALVRHPAKEVWSSVMDDVELMLARTVKPEDKARLAAWLAGQFRPLLDRIGFEPKAGDSADTRRARAMLTGFLALEADQESERKRLAAWGVAYTGFGGDGQWHVDAVPQDLASQSVVAAARVHGAAFLEHARALLAKTDAGVLRGRLLQAIAMVRDPALLAHAHELVKDQSLRSNERMMLLFGPARAAELGLAHLQWLDRSFAELLPLVPDGARDGVTAAFEGFCSAPEREALVKFATAHGKDLPGSERPTASALEAVDQCLALAARQPALVLPAGGGQSLAK